MKHISAYIGNQQEQAFERFAWFPVYSNFSKKRIWLKKYVELHIYYDSMGKPPVKGTSWNLIFTESEYTLYLLKKKNDASN
jgi:hypothetical protein